MTARAWLLVVLCCTVWSPGGRAAGGPATPAGRQGVPSAPQAVLPQAPSGALPCLEAYMRNMQRCAALWCHSTEYWLFTLTDCEEEQLGNCQHKAWVAYLACLEAGP